MTDKLFKRYRVYATFAELQKFEVDDHTPGECALAGMAQLCHYWRAPPHPQRHTWLQHLECELGMTPSY